MSSFNPDQFLDQSDTSAGGHSGHRSWSPFQERIFEAIRNPDQDLIIQAVAGSGKTSTLIEALRYAPGSVLFMAFNKSIAEDIRGRAPRGDIRTLNALGHGLWMKNSPRSKLDFDKLKKLTARVMPNSEFREWGYQVQKLVGMAKNLALDIDHSYDEMNLLEGMLELAQANDSLPPGRENDAAIYASQVFCASRADTINFDFDDQLYMPLYLGWEFPHYDNVFIDEAQDLSPIQHLMLQEFKSRGARVCAVGDRHQAIYGFRGADHNSMDNLKSRFSMLELPLSISYRCSKNVVKEAQVYCPSITWRDNAPEGSVCFRSDISRNEDPHLFTRELVVCRNNAPLFRAILRHVREKSPCRVLSNFLESFEGWIRGFKVDTCSELLARVSGWREKEITKAQEKNQKFRIAAIEDKADTLEVLCSGQRLVSEVLRLLKQLRECKSGPTFATIHKAKGLEADSVYFLRPDLLPSPWAESKSAKLQESNLAYVAVTRAKDLLTYGVFK